MFQPFHQSIRGRHLLPCLTTIASALVACEAYCASDGFDAVRCGADIPAALVGKAMSNDKVRVLEHRHEDLGLRDLGGSEISDQLFSASWQICGNEFMLLEDKRSVVRDVLRVPDHSKSSPAFVGTCAVNGKSVSGTIVAILSNEEGSKTLSAKAAWRIDERAVRFVTFPTAALRCPRDGVFTVDGGV
jgi:hypothetical protein